MNGLGAIVSGLTALLLTAVATAAEPDWNAVDQAIGKKGTDQPGACRGFCTARE